jgi:RNA polymerase sigma-70 factor (ECF subfamily)
MATDGAALDVPSVGKTDQVVDSVSDACLVCQLIDRRQDALARLYDRHGAAVFAAATRTSRDRWIAAEVVQETFLTLWNRAELFDASRGTLPAWLLTIARNRAVDHLRAAARHERAAAFSSFHNAEADDHSVVEWLTASGAVIGMAGPEPGPEVALSSKETLASIENAIASLAHPEREVIELAYGAGLTQSEIAARLRWPVGTVKTRTRRALGHLRYNLSGYRRPQRDPRSRASMFCSSPQARSTATASGSGASCPSA